MYAFPCAWSAPDFDTALITAVPLWPTVASNLLTRTWNSPITSFEMRMSTLLAVDRLFRSEPSRKTFACRPISMPADGGAS